MPEDLGQLCLHPLPFGFRQIEAREARDVIYGSSIDPHGAGILVDLAYRSTSWEHQRALIYPHVMHFPKELLADHEKVVFELRPHWLALVGPVFWSVVSLAVLFFSSKVLTDQTWEDTGNVVIAFGVLIAWILLAVVPFFQWLFTLFVLTSDRLITRSGVIAKKSKEIPLERINDVAFNQNIFERIVGAGDLLVESAGERGQERITNVRHPEQVQLMIYKESEMNSDRMMRGGAPASGSSVSVPQQIEALARLRGQGVLTDEEFEAKKADLLKRM